MWNHFRFGCRKSNRGKYIPFGNEFPFAVQSVSVPRKTEKSRARACVWRHSASVKEHEWRVLPCSGQALEAGNTGRKVSRAISGTRAAARALGV